jgi:hypothetical protein
MLPQVVLAVKSLATLCTNLRLLSTVYDEVQVQVLFPLEALRKFEQENFYLIFLSQEDYSKYQGGVITAINGMINKIFPLETRNLNHMEIKVRIKEIY